MINLFKSKPLQYIKPIACFAPEQGRFFIGAMTSQHRQLGPLVILTWGEVADQDKAYNHVLRMPAAKAIELGEYLVQQGQAAMAGNADIK